MKSEITKRALAGDKFDDLHIIDSHCHMDNYYSFYFPKADIDEMIKDADAIGMEKMCIAPHEAISSDYKLGNQKLLEAIIKYPDRIYGLLTLNPHKSDEIQGEFEKYYSARQFVGVKIHPGLHWYNVNDENYYRVYDKVRQYGGYVLTHSWEENSFCSISMCEEVIRDYPGVAFVLGHAGGTPEGVQKAIRLVNKYENAYLDTSGFEYSDTWIEEIAEHADNKKILFGSDYPFHDLRGGISRVLLSSLDDDIKRRILSDNLREMLSKYQKKKIPNESGELKIKQQITEEKF